MSCHGMWCYSVLLASQLNSANVYVAALHYSALLGGFAVVLSNGRAAFLTANSLKFEPSVSTTTCKCRAMLNFCKRCDLSSVWMLVVDCFAHFTWPLHTIKMPCSLFPLFFENMFYSSYRYCSFASLTCLFSISPLEITSECLCGW